MPKRSYEKDDNVQMDITIEMNLDYVTQIRTRYTILDVLADVGGMQSLLMSIFGFLLAICNYGNFDNNLAANMFKVKNRSDNSDESLLKPTKFCNFVEYFIDATPDQCRHKYCRKSRQMLAFQKARE